MVKVIVDEWFTPADVETKQYLKDVYEELALITDKEKRNEYIKAFANKARKDLEVENMCSLARYKENSEDEYQYAIVTFNMKNNGMTYDVKINENKQAYIEVEDADYIPLHDTVETNQN